MKPLSCLAALPFLLMPLLVPDQGWAAACPG
jgi:hypothetical protein